MKKGIRITSFLLSLAVLFASCASTTLIESTPGKAKVFLNGSYVGETPYRHTDTRIVGSSMMVKLEKEGYEPFTTVIYKDEEVNVGAIVGGLFVWVPFLWAMQYQPTHSYVLKPTVADFNPATPQEVPTTPEPAGQPKSKAEKIREFKQLLDDKIITVEEFEKEKARILNSNE